GSEGGCRGGEDSADAAGCGVGAGRGVAGYFGESSVCCGDSRGAAGCGGGAGFALPGVDDSAGGLDAAGAAYAATGVGNGGGCGGGGDDYALRLLGLDVVNRESKGDNLVASLQHYSPFFGRAGMRLWGASVEMTVLGLVRER